MARSVAITVYPWTAESEFLTVADAMRQVLDFVEFLEQLEDPVAEKRKIVWRLTDAHTNSPPLTVVATSFPSVTGMYIKPEAEQVAARAYAALASLVQGTNPEWLEPEPTVPLRRILERNLNVIGQTDIGVDDGNPISLSPPLARAASKALDQVSLEEDEEAQNLTRTEFGSIEGEVYGLSRWHSRPALQVVERLSGQKIVCVLNDAVAQKLGLNHKWAEVWEGRYLTLRGVLSYRPDGSIKRAEVESAKEIKWANVALDDLRDIDILEGRSVVEHLRRLWGE